MPLALPGSTRVFANRRLAPQNRETPGRGFALTALAGAALLCLAVYCASGAMIMTAGSLRLIPSQAENTYPESTNIYVALEAARTGHLYLSPAHPPYVLQPFGPLYYLTNAAIAWSAHLDFDLTRARGRWLAYAAFLLSAVIIFMICRKLRFSTIHSALAGLMFLAQPYFIYWNVTVRPDMLFLMLMLLSMLVAMRGSTFGGGSYAFAGFLAGLAFLVKQPAIAAPVAVLAVLLYEKEIRPAIFYAVGASLPVVLTFAILLWHRGPFLEQFFSVGKALWFLRDGVLFAFEKLDDVTVLAPIAIGIIGFVEAVRRDARSRMIALFALANWGVGLSGLPQLGANVNYFLPGLAGCALLLPFAVQIVHRNLRWKPGWVFIILALLWVSFHEIDRVKPLLSFHAPQSEKPYAALAPFKILSDRTIFTIHGRDPDLLDPYTAHELELAGRWDSAPIVENVRRGDYDLIILGYWPVVSHFRGVAYFSVPLVNAINENYVVLCSTLSSAVLKPRAREIDITPSSLGPALGLPCGRGLRGHPPNLTMEAGDR